MEKRRHTIDILFIVILIGAFAISSIALIVLGANVYQKTVSDNQQSYQVRTASLYFDQKLHQADNGEAISLEPMETGQQALVLSDTDYETWIFLSDGQLREATVKKGTNVTSGFGQPVLDLSSLEFTLIREDLLQVNAVSDEGNRSQINILLRSSRLEVRE